MIFKLKMIFINQGGKLFFKSLKCFLSNQNFIKKKKIQNPIFFVGVFYEKTSMRLLSLFLDTLFKICALHGNFDINSAYLEIRIFRGKHYYLGLREF